MPLIRVDFYLVNSDQHQTLGLIACRLLEKAYVRQHKVYVHCRDQNQAEFIDDLLWSFKEDSFVPHNLMDEGPEPPPPIRIGFDNEPRGTNDILLNLAPEIPVFHNRFKRIMELVSNQEVEKEQSRIHYKEYKSRGYELYTHEVSS